MMNKRMQQGGRTLQAVVGGVSGLVAVVIMLGLGVAQLTTSTRHAAMLVIASFTIIGAALGGFFLAPLLNGLALNVHGGRHDEDVS
jgi:hypothetical protein